MDGADHFGLVEDLDGVAVVAGRVVAVAAVVSEDSVVEALVAVERGVDGKKAWSAFEVLLSFEEWNADFLR